VPRSGDFSKRFRRIFEAAARRRTKETRRRFTTAGPMSTGFNQWKLVLLRWYATSTAGNERNRTPRRIISSKHACDDSADKNQRRANRSNIQLWNKVEFRDQAHL